MASNISSGSWRVKIISIPTSITVTQLAETVGLPKSHIYLPKVKGHNTHYAWVDHFVSEEEAHRFARQWSNSSILGETIKCVVAAPRDDEQNNLHSSSEPLSSGIEAIPNKQRDPRMNRGPKERRDNSNPPTIPVSLMSVITTEVTNNTINDDEKKSRKPLPNRSHQSLNQQQQRHTSGQAVQHVQTLGKLSYTNI